MAETIEGVVAQVYDDSGRIKLEGRADFFNRSQYADAQVELPGRGDRIRLAFAQAKNGKLYWNDVTVLGAPSNGAEEINPRSGEMRPGTFAFKDVAIIREVALKAALDYLKAKSEAMGESGAMNLMTPELVCQIAGTFETWIARAESEPEDYGGEP